MLLCFFKELEDGVGRGGEGGEMCAFLQRHLTCRISKIRLGAAFFCSPQLRRTFLIFPILNLLCDTGICE